MNVLDDMKNKGVCTDKELERYVGRWFTSSTDYKQSLHCNYIHFFRVKSINNLILTPDRKVMYTSKYLVQPIELDISYSGNHFVGFESTFYFLTSRVPNSIKDWKYGEDVLLCRYCHDEEFYFLSRMDLDSVNYDEQYFQLSQLSQGWGEPRKKVQISYSEKDDCLMGKMEAHKFFDDLKADKHPKTGSNRHYTYYGRVVSQPEPLKKKNGLMRFLFGSK